MRALTVLNASNKTECDEGNICWFTERGEKTFLSNLKKSFWAEKQFWKQKPLISPIKITDREKRERERTERMKSLTTESSVHTTADYTV